MNGTAPPTIQPRSDASPGPARHATSEAYRSRARDYDQRTDAFRRWRQLLVEQLPVQRGDTVLDVGCGTGIASRQMAGRGAKVLGVELAPRMAEIARSHGIDVELGAFEGWDAAGRTFDRVISTPSKCRARGAWLRIACPRRRR